MDRIEYVNGFLFSLDKKKIVLIRKKRPNWQEGKLNGIGGRIEGNETPLQAMQREFVEEAGIVIDDWLNFATLNGNDWKVYMFVSFSDDYSKCYSKTDEEIEIHYTFDISNLDVIPNLKWLIPMSIDTDNILTDVTYH